MIVAKPNYQEAKAYNCRNQLGHQFVIILDKEKKKEIRETFYPRMRFALWECVYCGKIKESM